MQPEIVDVIRGGGLSRVAEELEQQRIHSIRLKAEVTPEVELELEVSKLGGLPDLPKGTQWPQANTSPLNTSRRIVDLKPVDSSSLMG
jgi:hypothetical protein